MRRRHPNSLGHSAMRLRWSSARRTPWLSVDPILSVPGVREAVQSFPGRRLAVSPIVGGKALKGPAAKVMSELGYEVSSVGIASYYQNMVDTLVIDESDRGSHVFHRGARSVNAHNGNGNAHARRTRSGWRERSVGSQTSGKENELAGDDSDSGETLETRPRADLHRYSAPEPRRELATDMLGNVLTAAKQSKVRKDVSRHS